MNKTLPRERERHPCPPVPAALEARLDRLEGFLHHLMNDVRDALALLNSVKEAAGLGRAEQEPEELHPPL